MKNILILIFLLSTLPLYALKIETGLFQRDGQERPGIKLTMDIPVKQVKKAFQDYLKDNYDIKLKGMGLFTNKDELYAEEVVIKPMIDKNLNFYAQIIENNSDAGKTSMTIFAALGYDIYISDRNYPDDFSAMMDIAVGFANNYIPSYYEGQIKVSEEKQSDLKGSIKDLEKSIANNEKDIEKLREEITNMQQELEENRSQLTDAELQLQTRRNQLKEAKKVISNYK